MNDKNNGRNGKVIVDAPYKICGLCKKLESGLLHKCRKKRLYFDNNMTNDQPDRKKMIDLTGYKKKDVWGQRPDDVKKRDNNIATEQKTENVKIVCELNSIYDHHNNTKKYDNPIDVVDSNGARHRVKPLAKNSIPTIQSRLSEIQQLNDSVLKKWNHLKTFKIPPEEQNSYLNEMYEEFEERFEYAQSLISNSKRAKARNVQNNLKTAKIYLTHNMEQLEMIEIEQNTMEKRNIPAEKCLISRLFHYLFWSCFPLNN